MVCSASAGESGLNWLDRLRSSTGIPAGDNPNLASSLSGHTHAAAFIHPDSERAHSVQERVPIETSSGNGDGQWTNVMSNVLNELFCMGAPIQSSKISRMKCPRKQTNPRQFASSSIHSNATENSEDLLRKDENVLASKGGVVDTREGNLDVGHAEEKKDTEKGDNELAGYSKCEVTVIDTSSPVWKFEKLVFRKSDVWKVRDKKGKSTIFCKKKRRGNFGFNKNGGGKKKAKLSVPEFEQYSSGEGRGNLSNEYSQEKACKDISNDLGRNPAVRIPSSSLSKKAIKRSSSINLSKGMRTCKKNEAKVATSFPGETHSHR